MLWAKHGREGLLEHRDKGKAGFSQREIASWNTKASDCAAGSAEEGVRARRSVDTPVAVLLPRLVNDTRPCLKWVLRSDTIAGTP